MAALNAQTPITALKFSTRVVNALLHADIKTAGDLAAARDCDLWRLVNFGRTSLAEVRSVVPYGCNFLEVTFGDDAIIPDKEMRRLRVAALTCAAQSLPSDLRSVNELTYRAERLLDWLIGETTGGKR